MLRVTPRGGAGRKQDGWFLRWAPWDCGEPAASGLPCCTKETK